jgi:hypothetical protein
VFDYRVGVLSKPVWHEDYTPDPSSAWRPAIGVGVTPFTGVRIGASATTGSYLGSDDAVFIAGEDWRRYKQHVVAADLQLSRGYFEANAELARASYDVPERAEAAKGLTWYVETKYTFTPRFYLAARVERNDYPYISPLVTPFTGPIWIASNSDFTDVEIGGGFRVTSSTLLKVSVRADHWVPNPNPNAPTASGRAVAMQLSQTFDVVELVTRR